MITDPSQGSPAMNDLVRLHAKAIEAYNRKEWQQALALSRQLLPSTPEPAELHYLAGLSAMELQQMPVALEHLHQAVKLHPSRVDIATQFAKALSLVNLSADAVRIANHALALAPTDAQALDTLGVVFTRANAHEQATALYSRASALAPDRASIRYNLATSLAFLGRTDEAERELEHCIGLAPRFWDAHLALAQLHRQSASGNHLPRLCALLPEAAGDPSAQMKLHMALAKEYEDLADYPKSFEHLISGKAAGRRLRPANSTDRDAALFDKLIGTAAQPAHATAAGHPSGEPIFVVGMPRTGTTLVERILSSHPHVHAAGELLNFPIAYKRATGSRTPAMLDPDTIERAHNIEWRSLGDAYLASTRPGTGHTPRFVDKLPHNFLYLGAIAAALPNAKIVCLRRNPMDTCLSNFRQLFVGASSYYDYSFDLLDIGRYYIQFDRLMAHWKQSLPGRILELDYETLVASQETATRQLLEFCNLSWNDACLRFETNPTPVTTPSAPQVRKPINSHAIQRWKQYAPQLAALRELLEAAGIAIAH